MSKLGFHVAQTLQVHNLQVFGLSDAWRYQHFFLRKEPACNSKFRYTSINNLTAKVLVVPLEIVQRGIHFLFWFEKWFVSEYDISHECLRCTMYK